MQFISKPQRNAPAVVLPTVATPTFAPVAGSYPVTQSVTISCSTPASNIFYTTDGTVPTTSSIHYTVPVSVSVSETLNAIATAVGFLQSAVGTAVYSIAVPQTATPTFAPVAGTYIGTQSVAISCSTPSSSIYFTTDGSAPTFPITGTTTLYTGSISVVASETLKAIGAASGFTNSAVASAAYVINAPVAVTPTFSPVAGAYATTQTVTLSCSTPSSSIYFTIDGSTPTFPIIGTTILYSGPITVSATETIKAIGVASGFANSAVGTAAYTIGGTVFDFYVSPTGDDNNAGTQASPWSITGIDSNVSCAGKKIGFMSGTYQFGIKGGVQTSLWSIFNSKPNNVPMIQVQGGPSITQQTLVQSITPRAAIINCSNPSTGAYPTGFAQTGETGAIGQSTQTTHQGNVIIDGLFITRTFQNAILFHFAGTPEGGVTGIEVRNCEVFDITGELNNNPGGIHFEGCTGAWLHHCKIHSVQPPATGGNAGGNPDDVGGIFSFFCHSNIYEFNTVYDCNNAVFEKSTSNGNHIWRYNYFESNGLSPQNAIHGGSGGQTGDTQQIYNNIIVNPQTNLWDATLSSTLSHQSLDLHNNTFLFKSVGGNGGIHYPSAGTGVSPTATTTQYNNVFSYTTGAEYLWVYNSGSVILSDYQLVGTSAAGSGILAMSTDTGDGTGHTLASWQSSFGFDAHSAALNPTFVSPTFSNTSLNPAGWALSPGTAGTAGSSTHGSTTGTTGGAACDMGAWGGVSPPTQIGCGF